MTEYVTIKPDQVAVGDEVKVDGMGHYAGSTEYIESTGSGWRIVKGVSGRVIVTNGIDRDHYYRRSSIVEARRKKPFDAEEVGRKIVEDAFKAARAELRKRHVLYRQECNGPEYCLCVEPAPKPEPAKPEPKVGEWRCFSNEGNATRPCPRVGHHNERCVVYRSTGVWSKDERTGQPWVPVNGSPIDVTMRCAIGHRYGFSESFTPAPSWDGYTGYYKRLGLDVRPVERRKAAK